MRKPIALLIAGLTLSPVTAEAAACRLDQATFRPRLAQDAYVLRSSINGGDLQFELSIRSTSETFRFHVEIDGSMGEGMITSVPGGAGRDPGIKTGFRLFDVNSLKTTPQGEIGQISFLDLGRGFVDFRLRERPQPEPYTTPPSGLWKVTECRAKELPV
jgi:hypothetical protein